MMENPYESSRPELDEPTFDPSWDADTADEVGPGRVGEVRIVAMLMIGQGFLECLCGVFTGLFAVFAGVVLTSPELSQEMGPNYQQSAWISAAMYGGISLIGFVTGVLHMVAGARNYRFRGRTLGFVALAGGLVSAFTVCCCPTTVGLCIYGMIVYLDPSVTRAFEMASQGSSPDEILKQFQPYQTA